MYHSTSTMSTYHVGYLFSEVFAQLLSTLHRYPILISESSNFLYYFWYRKINLKMSCACPVL